MRHLGIAILTQLGFQQGSLAFRKGQRTQKGNLRREHFRKHAALHDRPLGIQFRQQFSSEIKTLEQALRRELQEEIGITIGTVHPWQQEVFDYPHARVRLHFCKVYDWTGSFEMREAQQMAWADLPVAVAPVLPGTVPVLRWFAAERAWDGPLHS